MKDFNKYFIVGTNSDALHDTMNGTVTGELIRCRDCKHYNPSPINMGYCLGVWGLYVDEDGYCYKGEREKDPDDNQRT